MSLEPSDTSAIFGTDNCQPTASKGGQFQNLIVMWQIPRCGITGESLYALVKPQPGHITVGIPAVSRKVIMASDRAQETSLTSNCSRHWGPVVLAKTINLKSLIHLPEINSTLHTVYSQ